MSFPPGHHGYPPNFLPPGMASSSLYGMPPNPMGMFPGHPPPYMLGPGMQQFPNFPPPFMMPPMNHSYPPPFPNNLNLIEQKPTTVFISNIVDKIDNEFMEQILGVCGAVNSFKRLVGAKGTLQPFGFCEFSTPESAQLSLEVFVGLTLAGKGLSFKVDAKTQTYLESYFKSRGMEGHGHSASFVEDIKNRIFQMAQEKNDTLSSPSGESDNVVQDLKAIRASVESPVDEDDCLKISEEDLAHHNEQVLQNLLKRIERNKAEKEAIFAEREKKWIAREKDRANFYETQRQRFEKEQRNMKDREVDMEEFLNSYDDDRDDSRYYSGSKMIRLVQERRRELADDKRARARYQDLMAPISQPEKETEYSGDSVGMDYGSEAQSSGLEASHEASNEGENNAQENVSSPEKTTKTAIHSLCGAESGDANCQNDSMVCDGSQLSEPKKAKKTVQELIDSIPCTRELLYAFPMEWSFVDSDLVEDKLKPWVRKKIIEYVGECEPLLVDFICKKVLQRCHPREIQEEISLVLEEESEVFVLKLWRFLIYETEALKFDLV